MLAADEVMKVNAQACQQFSNFADPNVQAVVYFYAINHVALLSSIPSLLTKDLVCTVEK